MINIEQANSKGRTSEGEWLQTRSGERCLIRVSGFDVKGAYSLVEIISKPGDGTPMHVHELEDEHIIVLEGMARIAYGNDILNARAGEMVSLRKGVPHAWGNRSDSQLHLAVVAFPGGCEEALRLMIVDQESDLSALAARFRIGLVGPAPF